MRSLTIIIVNPICTAMKQSINLIFKFQKKVSKEYTLYNLHLPTYVHIYAFLKLHVYLYIFICIHIHVCAERRFF